MSNFAFLKPEWPEIHSNAERVEELALVDPRGSCFYARLTLEQAVDWLYGHDGTLQYPYSDNLSAPQNIRLAAGEFHDYAIPAGGIGSVRFWPKLGCDGNGRSAYSYDNN